MEDLCKLKEQIRESRIQNETELIAQVKTENERLAQNEKVQEDYNARFAAYQEELERKRKAEEEAARKRLEEEKERLRLESLKMSNQFTKKKA